MAWCSV